MVIGNYVYASNEADNTISAFSINTTTGVLTAVGSPIAVPGTSESGITLASALGGKYLVAGNYNALTSYSIGSSGALTQANSITISANPDGISCQLSGSYCAYADAGSGAQVFSVASNGTLALGAFGTAGTWITDVAFTKTGSYLYSVTNDTLYVWAVDSSGNLTAVTGFNPFTVGDSSLGQSIAITPDSKYFFTGNPNLGYVGAYALTTSGGATEITGAPWSINQPTNACVTVDGLYVVFGSYDGPVTLWSNTAGVLAKTSSVTDSGNTGSSFSVAVYPAPLGIVSTTTTLTLSSYDILVSNPVTLTATVTGSSAPTSGTITFYDGTTSIGTGTLNASGVATLTLSNFTVGTHSLTASYPGSTGFAASTSSAKSLLVQDFNFTIAGGGSVISATVLPGNTATYSFTVAPTNGTTFPAQVNFILTGLPPGATYTVAPPFLAAGSSSQTVTVTVQTATATSSARHAKLEQKRSIWAPALAMLLPMAGIVLLRRRVKRWAPVLVLLAIALTMGAVSCGGSGNGFYAQAPVTYAMPFTASSGPLLHGITLDLTIQ